ncbi:MAG: N-acetylmuramoyl-L-alanine amidase [Actinobacteria bacterium]|nr:N-acetylmuramoyl-L-alanine amidase [Actinomycetota bacterium]MCA1719944.1 N-acetylmuramoyl-L-alanine amidase [Actinomycetota bacterium]
MSRLLSSLAVVGLLTPAVVGLPVVTAPTEKPHPVPPSVSHVALSQTLSSFALPARATKDFTTVGVTWRHDDRVREVTAEVRWRKGGTWSSWRTLSGDRDDVPDAGTIDTTAGLRDGTAPLWVGRSNGVQVRATASGPVQPADVRVELVDPGTSAADLRPTPRDVASAAQEQPPILTRADWGADESIRRGSPSYNATVKVGFVHHTDTANGYSMAEVPAMLRSIYAYHVQSNGWSDIGYNYLVDRFGRVWEGRYGGITRAVIGAHTGGFNTDSFGTSLLGDYTTEVPSAATLTSLEQLFAWKLGSYYRDPIGQATLRSAGGGTSKYPAGTYHTFDVVSGHRDAGNTSCPGNATYARMSMIRAAIDDFVGASFVAPAASTKTTYVGSSTPVTVKALTRRAPVWTLDVLSSAGVPVRTFAGADPSVVDVAWDLKDASGVPVPPGAYTLRLSGTSPEGEVARPWTAPVTVRFPSIPKGSWMKPKQYVQRG